MQRKISTPRPNRGPKPSRSVAFSGKLAWKRLLPGFYGLLLIFPFCRDGFMMATLRYRPEEDRWNAIVIRDIDGLALPVRKFRHLKEARRWALDKVLGFVKES